MATDDERLSPQDLSAYDSVISSHFNDKVQNKSQDRSYAVIETKTPDAIKNHNPHPAMRPPWDTRDADREKHSRALHRDREKYKQNDPFEKTDREKEQAQQRDQNRGDRGRE